MEESSFTEAELAARARVTPELVGRLVELRILRPTDGEARYGLGDVRRVRLVEACAQAGLPWRGSGPRSPRGGCRWPSSTCCRSPGSP
jgi:hypothetical protein